MTPIDNYVIFYHQGVEPSSLQDLKNISTTTNDTRTLNITGISEPGAYMVGVAAVNSAGRGSVEYISESLGRGLLIGCGNIMQFIIMTLC